MVGLIQLNIKVERRTGSTRSPGQPYDTQDLRDREGHHLPVYTPDPSDGLRQKLRVGGSILS